MKSYLVVNVAINVINNNELVSAQTALKVRKKVR